MKTCGREVAMRLACPGKVTLTVYRQGAADRIGNMVAPIVLDDVRSTGVRRLSTQPA
jgi:hypothetical protein